MCVCVCEYVCYSSPITNCQPSCCCKLIYSTVMKTLLKQMKKNGREWEFFLQTLTDRWFMKGIINVGSVTSNLSSNLNHLTLTHEMFRERIIKKWQFLIPQWICTAKNLPLLNGGLLSGVIQHTQLVKGKWNGKYYSPFPYCINYPPKIKAKL